MEQDFQLAGRHVEKGRRGGASARQQQKLQQVLGGCVVRLSTCGCDSCVTSSEYAACRSTKASRRSFGGRRVHHSVVCARSSAVRDCAAPSRVSFMAASTPAVSSRAGSCSTGLRRAWRGGGGGDGAETGERGKRGSAVAPPYLAKGKNYLSALRRARVGPCRGAPGSALAPRKPGQRE